MEALLVGSFIREAVKIEKIFKKFERGGLVVGLVTILSTARQCMFLIEP
jgi:hypothetical protein